MFLYIQCVNHVNLRSVHVLLLVLLLFGTLVVFVLWQLILPRHQRSSLHRDNF